jgi:hypothetical protein
MSTEKASTITLTSNDGVSIEVGEYLLLPLMPRRFKRTDSSPRQIARLLSAPC